MKRTAKIRPSEVASLPVAICVAAWIVIRKLPDLISVEYETNSYESSTGICAVRTNTGDIILTVTGTE